MLSDYVFFQCCLKTITGFYAMEGPHKHTVEREQIHTICLTSSTSLNENPPSENAHHHHLSVTAVLNYCKHKILNPYLRLLSITGLRPLAAEQEPCLCVHLINWAYIIQVILFLIIGYILQYMACFRRDRGFCYRTTHNMYMMVNHVEPLYEEICQGPVLFSFIVPSCLHLLGYLHAVAIIRHSDDDKLPVLMERVFLLSTNLSNGVMSQKKLIKTLWLFVIISTIWMMLSLGTVNCMMANGTITFKWLEDGNCILILASKILLIISTLWHDIVQATIISNYCLQTQLFIAFIQMQRDKFLQHTVHHSLEWMRDIEDFKKLLSYMNNEIAPSVCIFTIMNLSCGLSGLLWLCNYDNIDTETSPIKWISVINVFLWLFIALAPFIQAAKLSSACEVLRNVGQEARIRPFVHQDTPGVELDSILLYTISLKLRAKLFFIPITAKYLCLIVVVLFITILVLGQCHYLNFRT